MKLTNIIGHYCAKKAERREQERQAIVSKLEQAIYKVDTEMERVQNITLNPSAYEDREAVINYYLDLHGIPERNYSLPNGSEAARLTRAYIEMFIDRRWPGEPPFTASELLTRQKEQMVRNMAERKALYERAREVVRKSHQPQKEIQRLQHYLVASATYDQRMAGGFCNTFVGLPPIEPF